MADSSTIIRKGATIHGVTLTRGILTGPQNVRDGVECAVRGHEWSNMPMKASTTTVNGIFCARCGTSAA